MHWDWVIKILLMGKALGDLSEPYQSMTDEEMIADLKDWYAKTYGQDGESSPAPSEKAQPTP